MDDSDGLLMLVLFIAFYIVMYVVIRYLFRLVCEELENDPPNEFDLSDDNFCPRRARQARDRPGCPTCEQPDLSRQSSIICQRCVGASIKRSKPKDTLYDQRRHTMD